MSGVARYIALALAIVGVLAVLAFVRDPFGWQARRLKAARAEAVVAAADAAARRLEAREEADGAARVSRAAKRSATGDQLTATLSETAKAAPDAHVPLDPQRLGRLRAHDVELCRLAALDGCPAAPEHAADGR